MGNEEYRIEGDRSEVTPESKSLLWETLFIVAFCLLILCIVIITKQSNYIIETESKLNFATDVAKDCIKNK